MRRSILHYTIEAELGAGSMGRVYRARDTRTGRQVALKLLASSGDSEARARMLREGRATARLSHPGIAALYAIEESEGEVFLVQELVTGEPLADRIARQRLTVPEAMRLARDVAAALAHAHQNGVLHRDLKPSNILVAGDGAYKIVDFGISHIQGASTITGRGSVTGTLPYMSPERISGEAGDVRSDLFSLGAVLYESLTGQRAFSGDTETDVMMRILNEDPPLLRLPGQGSAAFASLIARLMAREPQQRPPTAEAVGGIVEGLMSAGSEAIPVGTPAPHTTAHATAGPRDSTRRYILTAAALIVVIAAALGLVRLLRQRPVPPAGAGAPSVAVLYFENVADPEDADKIGAIAGHLLVTSLAQNPSLDVLSTQTVLDALYRIGARGDRVDRETAMKVARAVKAGRIVTGSVLQIQPYIVMTSEVTDVQTGRLVHAARVEGRPGEAIFAVIDGLSADLVRRLSPADAQASVQPVAQQTSGNLEAMRLYVEGIESLANGELHRAEPLLEAALARDPSFPQALFSLAIVKWWLNEPVSAQATAALALRESARLSPREREFVGCVSELAAGRYEKAAEILRRMAARYPDDKMVAYGLVECAFHSGDWAGAIENAKRTLQIDPHFTLAAVHLVDGLTQSSRAAEAETAARQFLAAAPHNEPLWRSLFESLIWQGKGDAVIAAASDAVDAGVSVPWLLAAAVIAIDRGARLDQIDVRWYQVPDSSYARDRAAGLEYWHALHHGRFHEATVLADRAWALDRSWNDSPPMADGLGAALATGDGRKLTELTGMVNQTLVGNPLWRPTGLMVPLYFMYRQGRTEEARRELSRIEALPESDNAVYRGPIHFVQALIAGREGRTAEALRLLGDSRSVVQPHFALATIRWARSQILLDGGSWEAAVSAIDTLLGAPVLDPCDAILLRFQRGQALEHLGRRDAARAAYLDFLEIWKDADREIPEIIEARKAVKRLQGSS